MPSLDGFWENKPAPCPRCEGPSSTRRFGAGVWRPVLCETCTAEQEVQDAILARKAEEVAQLAQCEAMVHQLNVPPLYADVSLSTYEMHGDGINRTEQNRLIQLVRRYVLSWPDVPPIVVMQGPPGTGKGHLLWTIAKSVAGEHGDRAQVVTLGDTIRDLRDAWDKGEGPSESTRLTRYRSPKFLAIDEVSRHAFYGQPQQHLYDLVDYREQWLRPTILTTNESGSALAEMLGPALMSRCAGWGSLWTCGNADYRLRRGKQRNEEGA